MSDFLLAGDVGRMVGLTAAAVREAAATGRLQVAARTEGNVRLFERAEVERFKREREARTAGSTGIRARP
jgi:hypothetical protein